MFLVCYLARRNLYQSKIESRSVGSSNRSLVFLTSPAAKTWLVVTGGRYLVSWIMNRFFLHLCTRKKKQVQLISCYGIINIKIEIISVHAQISVSHVTVKLSRCNMWWWDHLFNMEDACFDNEVMMMMVIIMVMMLLLIFPDTNICQLLIG